MFKEAFRVANDSIIIAVPLIFFIKIIDLYSNFALYRADSTAKFFLATITLIFLVGAFSAAYFYMVKRSIEISKKVFVIDSDRTKEILEIFKSSHDGISKYFVSFAAVYIILLAIEILLTPLVYLTGVRLIGHISPELIQGIQSVAADSSAVSAFVDGLTTADMIFFAKWSLLLVAVASILMFLLMLWIPEIIYKTRNPLSALFKSIKKVFVNFGKSVKIYLGLYALGFLVFCLASFSFSNLAVYFISNFVIYYFYLYITILIFLYYDKKYNVTDNEE